MMIFNRAITAGALALTLTGCSSTLPLDYKEYTGSDAATLYVRNAKGNVGTIYLSTYKYVEKEACYERDTRYELDSNFLKADGAILKNRIAPGHLYAVEHTDNKGKWIYYYTTPFIPEAGKHYYLVDISSVTEIPASANITYSMTDTEIVRLNTGQPVKSWNAKAQCKNAVGKFYDAIGLGQKKSKA